MRLGDLLIRGKLVTTDDVARALEHQAKHGGRLGENLIAIKALTQEALDGKPIARWTPVSVTGGQRLKIGRTPIREALQRLAHENLVHSVPHRGTFVTDVKITDLARITEVRVVLEGHAARLAAERCTTGDQATL